ncbi:MAG: TaqI-like C-terminal specificity domain-containing protein [Sulfuricurvum sp.]|nr:TaqI-like C-terminal specificity domain-containing protein [Sulfuricurvum sp.]
MSIFQKSVLNSIKQDESIIALRWANFQNYLTKIDFIKTVKEEKYQDGFLKDIFESCLGYTLDSTNPHDFNLEREKKNETDSKKADGVIYVNSEIIGIVELKDQKTKNLDAVESQAFNYHASHSNSKYIIISNFNELRFYIDKKTAYEKFNLFGLTYEDFKTLHLLLSFESIRDNLPIKLKEDSIKKEQNISKELYRDFSQFRSHLFENIIKNNDLDRSLLLRLTQKLCDRIIFILFAEDRSLLKTNTVKEIRSRHAADGFGDRSMYDYYKLYFNAINTGNDKLGIPKYNGGLFATDEMLDSLKIDDSYLDMEAQKLSDFDFESEISVNILGHIFEQSLTDLEEMNASINDTEFDKKKSKRKKDGVFYTPEYITRYIVENTLGKLCSDKKEALKIEPETVVVNPRKLTKSEQSYKETLLNYREWLTHLKILDPACGSGAFLNQALEFLIREHTLIRDLLLPYEDLMIGYEIEKSILEHNLYGVDINEDAVEIARLSLWLRTAHKGRELINLGAKIKCGNSLISDCNVAENAFVWEDEFPEVFAQGGFDVVIGNPPYVRQEMLAQEAKNHFAANYATYHGMADLYVFFVERGYSLLREGGKFSYIFPNKWMRAGYGKPLRTFLMDKNIEEIIDFGDLPVFEEATTYPLILTMSKREVQETFKTLELKSLDFGDLGIFVTENAQTVAMSGLSAESYSMGGENGELLEKLKRNSITLHEYLGGEAYRGVLTGLNEAFVIDEATKNELISSDSKSTEVIKPFLAGRDVKRYELPKAEKYLILFPKGSTRQRSGFTAENEAWEWLKQTYPAIAKWFEAFAEKGRKRTDKGEFWWELRACAYYEEFEKPKIMYQVFQVKPAFVYDTNGTYCNNAMWMLPKDDKVLLAILNSKIGWFLISSYCTSIQNGYQLIWKYLEQIPIPATISDEERTKIEKLVDAQLELVAKLSNLQDEFKDYLSSALSVAKIPAKLDAPEKMSFDELQSALTKLKVDMKDISIFRSIKQLYDEMMELQKEVDRVDGEIDKMVGDLYGIK